MKEHILHILRSLWEKDRRLIIVFSLSFFASGLLCVTFAGYAFMGSAQAYDIEPIQTNETHGSGLTPTKNPTNDSINAPIISPPTIEIDSISSEQDSSTFVYVDVSGAVSRPGVYTMKEGARISDAIAKAGGLGLQADVDFFARNYNAARKVSDQEKIYVPSLQEVENKIFVEGTYVIDTMFQPSVERGSSDNKNLAASSTSTSTSGTTSSSNSSTSSTGTSNQESTDKISVNTARSSELQSLVGVGEVTAQKIIDNRPYTSLDELLDRKVIRTDVYEKNLKILSL